MINTKEDRGRNYWNPFLAFPRNWLHQGLSYMDNGERIFRLTTELFLTVFLWMLFLSLVNGFTQNFLAILLSGIIVHTLNWLFNCQFWCLLIHLVPLLKNPGKNRTRVYLTKMVERLKNRKSIKGIAVFGSVSRNQWHNRSDIDLRILREQGIFNCAVSCSLATRERLFAFFLKQPLDLYVADSVEWLQSHMRRDEKPIFLLKHAEKLEKAYPDNPPIKVDGLFLAKGSGCDANT